MQNVDELPAPSTLKHDQNPDRANLLVVFVDYTECRYLRCLKQGFRHCFVAVRNHERWVICDLLKNRIEFSIVHIPFDFDLGDFYRSQGHTVIVGYQSDTNLTNSSLPEFMTCVSVTKRILGIRSFWTFTPWQLFHLLISKDDRWRLVD